MRMQFKTLLGIGRFGMVAFLCSAGGRAAAAELDQTTTQWRPFVEWSLANPSFSGNPYDLEATVTFRHPNGETRQTGMFYDRNNTWKFRFTGTRTGTWSFTTASEDPELDGRSGTVTVKPNPDPKAHGFLTHFGNKWGWQGTDHAMVPQLVMYDDPPDFADNAEKIHRDIQTFLQAHRFNGFHVAVLGRWFDLDQTRYDGIDSNDPNPDPRTFESLELLITQVHQAGGMVHLWAWGDEQRHMTPIKWGINGHVDHRLQRYIAARLGPLPGWTMGYGFDLDEWVAEDDMRGWHNFMHRRLGWFHFLGGRSGGPNRGTDHRGWQIYDGLDYAGYEHHQPTYEVYRAALAANPNKPVFSEDRFRIRRPSPYPDKDYTESLTRRGLWNSTLAGGVANIWGNLTNPNHTYTHKEWIQTWAHFFESRFRKDLTPANKLTDGVCLKSADNAQFIFYKEDADSLQLDLSPMPTEAPAIAVDALKPYLEITLGPLKPKIHRWTAPYPSDWAVAVERNSSEISPPNPQ